MECGLDCGVRADNHKELLIPVGVFIQSADQGYSYLKAVDPTSREVSFRHS
jgi:hypothetical protein